MEQEADYYAPYRVALADLPEPEVIPEDANVIYLLDQEVRKVFPDGTSRRTIHKITRVLNTPGISQAATQMPRPMMAVRSSIPIMFFSHVLRNGPHCWSQRISPAAPFPAGESLCRAARRQTPSR